MGNSLGNENSDSNGAKNEDELVHDDREEEEELDNERKRLREKDENENERDGKRRGLGVNDQDPSRHGRKHKGEGDGEIKINDKLGMRKIDMESEKKKRIIELVKKGAANNFNEAENICFSETIESEQRRLLMIFFREIIAIGFFRAFSHFFSKLSKTRPSEWLIQLVNDIENEFMEDGSDRYFCALALRHYSVYHTYPQQDLVEIESSGDGNASAATIVPRKVSDILLKAIKANRADEVANILKFCDDKSKFYQQDIESLFSLPESSDGEVNDLIMDMFSKYIHVFFHGSRLLRSLSHNFFSYAQRKFASTKLEDLVGDESDMLNELIDILRNQIPEHDSLSSEDTETFRSKIENILTKDQNENDKLSVTVYGSRSYGIVSHRSDLDMCIHADGIKESDLLNITLGSLFQRNEIKPYEKNDEAKATSTVDSNNINTSNEMETEPKTSLISNNSNNNHIEEENSKNGNEETLKEVSNNGTIANENSMDANNSNKSYNQNRRQDYRRNNRDKRPKQITTYGPLNAESLQTIRGARVPIIRFYAKLSEYRAHNIKVEISFNNYEALCNTAWIKGQCDLFPPLKQLIRMLRHWCNCNLGIRYMVMTSHAWNALCVYFLQKRGYLPACSPNFDPSTVKNQQMARECWNTANIKSTVDVKSIKNDEKWLVKLLVDFFMFWAFQFEYAGQRNLINVRDPNNANIEEYQKLLEEARLIAKARMNSSSDTKKERRYSEFKDRNKNHDNEEDDDDDKDSTASDIDYHARVLKKLSIIDPSSPSRDLTIKLGEKKTMEIRCKMIKTLNAIKDKQIAMLEREFRLPKKHVDNKPTQQNGTRHYPRNPNKNNNNKNAKNESAITTITMTANAIITDEDSRNT